MPLHCTMVDAGKQIGGAILYGSIGPHRTPRFYGPTKPLFART